MKAWILQNVRESMGRGPRKMELYGWTSDLCFSAAHWPPFSIALPPAVLWLGSPHFFFRWPAADLMLQETVWLHPVEVPRTAPCSGCQGHSCAGSCCSDPAGPRNGVCWVQLNASENFAIGFSPELVQAKIFRGLKSERICLSFTGTRWSPSFITRALGGVGKVLKHLGEVAVIYTWAKWYLFFVTLFWKKYLGFFSLLKNFTNKQFNGVRVAQELSSWMD